jgi:hypothetical protein
MSEYLIAANAVQLVVCIGLVVAVVKLRRRVKALAAQRPTVTSPQLVRNWKLKMACYKPGSPKHTAYRNRLAEIGELDGD